MIGLGCRGSRKTKSLALKRSPDSKQIITIEMENVWLRCIQGSPWGQKEEYLLSNTDVTGNKLRTSLILTDTLLKYYYLYPHFTNEAVET